MEMCDFTLFYAETVSFHTFQEEIRTGMVGQEGQTGRVDRRDV